jgi:hypothetical protein
VRFLGHLIFFAKSNATRAAYFHYSNGLMGMMRDVGGCPIQMGKLEKDGARA